MSPIDRSHQGGIVHFWTDCGGLGEFGASEVELWWLCRAQKWWYREYRRYYDDLQEHFVNH